MQDGWGAFLDHPLSMLAAAGFDQVAQELTSSYLERLRRSWPKNRLSLSHMDFHSTNYFFDSGSPDDPIVLFDWQAGAIGRTTQDLEAMLIASFTAEFRRAHEREVVGCFYQNLGTAQTNIYSYDECWFDYEQGLLVALRLIPQFVTELDLESEYGKTVGAKIVSNLSAAVMDFGGMKFLDRLAP